MCDKCNDTGILGIRNGDDDIPCDCNEINEQPVNTTAVQEPLSPEAELRLHLAMYDELFCTVSPRSTDAEWQPFMAVQDEIYNNPDEKYHMLLDLLDASRKECELLKQQLEVAEKRSKWLDWVSK